MLLSFRMTYRDVVTAFTIRTQADAYNLILRPPHFLEITVIETCSLEIHRVQFGFDAIVDDPLKGFHRNELHRHVSHPRLLFNIRTCGFIKLV